MQWFGEEECQWAAVYDKVMCRLQVRANKHYLTGIEAHLIGAINQRVQLV